VSGKCGDTKENRDMKTSCNDDGLQRASPFARHVLALAALILLIASAVTNVGFTLAAVSSPKGR
jgi:hypothetical protein